MPFLALNSAEDEIREKEEKHTLEFQFEDARQLFEKALLLQKDAELGAKQCFIDLLKFQLFDFDRHKNVPPSTFRLKALALKNYSLLLLDELKVSMDPEMAAPTLKVVLNQLLSALKLSEDPAVVEILCSLALNMGYPKIARVALEQLVSSSGTRALSAIEATKSANSTRLLGPKDQDNLSRLKKVILWVGDETKLPDFITTSSFRRDFSWIKDFKFGNTLKELTEDLESATLTVSVPKRDISVLIDTVEQSLNSVAKKKKKDVGDLYTFTTKPINAVDFIAPHGDAIVVAADMEGSVPPEEEKSPTPAAIPDEALEAAASQVDPLATGTASPQVSDSAASTVKVESAEPASQLSSQATANDVALRQSKRNRMPDFGISTDFGASDVAFINHISSYLALTGINYENTLMAYKNAGTGTPNSHLAIFKELLAKWDDEQAQVFLGSGAPEVDVSQPVMQLLDFAAVRNAKPVSTKEAQRTDLVEEILEKVQNTSHIQQVRFQILSTILCSKSETHPLINCVYLDPVTLQNISGLIDAFAPRVLELCREATDERCPQLAEALYEWHLEKYLTFKRENRFKQTRSAKGNRKKANLALQNEEQALKEAVDRWRGVTGDMMLQFRDIRVLRRYEWAAIFHSQVEGDEPEETIAKFDMYKGLMEYDDEYGQIPFANYQTIPTASIHDAQTQISKFGAASIFQKVFLPTSSEDGIRENIDLLERMLMPEDHSMDAIPESLSIKQFLESSSVDFKLNLWYLLLDNYEKIGETRNSLDGLIRILKSSIEECTADNMQSKTPPERSSTILQSLSVAHEISLRLLPLIRDNQKLISELDKTAAREILECVVRLCELMHIFTLTDQAINSNQIKAPHHRTWENAVKKFRDLDVINWCLFYYLFRTVVPVENCTVEVLNDILSIIHEHLGHLGYCGLADGALLELNISEILRLDWTESEADLLQCLNCRHGISLANESFTPFNHHAVPVDLTRPNALSLTRFIMRMILNKKNLAQVIQRQNVRQVLDIFHNAIGAPDTSVLQIRRNEGILNDFIDSKATLPMMKACFHGKHKLSLTKSHDPTFALIGDGGFYYVMALVHLNQYRIKRRTNPEKVDDLHQAIKFFKYDLTYGTDRFESWMGLCQAHDHLSETSLMFSPPSAQKVEHSAVDFHSKGILCGCMAVSVLPFTNAANTLSPDYFNSIKDSVYASLGKLLYYSAVSPLSMEVYNLSPVKRFVYKDDKYEEATSLVDERIILKLAYRFLQQAVDLRSEDWFSCLLMAEVCHSLDYDAHKVLQISVEAKRICAANPVRESKGGLDLTFEPLQSLIYFLWHYFHKGNITPDELVAYLQELAFPFDAPDTDNPKSYFTAILQVIGGLISADKKHWLHLPRYLMAQIYEYNLDDSRRAQQEMETFISVKSNAKALVQIWKPENERPGQHFEYCREYVIFYSDLLVKNKEDLLIGLLARKVRKFVSIADHVKVWNHVISCATTLGKELVQFPRKFTETTIPLLVPEEFEKRAQDLERWVQEKASSCTSVDTMDPWVLAMDYAQDLKKLNIGFGSTVAIDELVIAFYLGLYETFKPLLAPSIHPNSIPIKAAAPPPTAPSDTDRPMTTTPFGEREAKKKARINRKDILQKAVLTLKPINAKLYGKSDKCIPKALYGRGKELTARDEDDGSAHAAVNIAQHEATTEA